MDNSFTLKCFTHKVLLTSRAEPRLRAIERGQICLLGDGIVHESEMSWLVLHVIGARQRHRVQQIKCDLAVRFWIIDRFALAGWLRLFAIIT